MLKIVKFGGTSVNTVCHRECAIKKIKNELNNGNKVLVVISAMGRNDEPYSTNTLLTFSKFLDDRQKDRLLAQGEILSTLVFENECREHGIKAHACTPSETGIITDDIHGCANVLKTEIMWIEHFFKTNDVIVVPGFIGVSQCGHITTLGRGGSDKTAILLAKAMNVNHVAIYTDVDGIYDKDPKRFASAKRYDYMSYAECLKLIDEGACVMMKESVLLAEKYGIKFSVASTFESVIGTKVGGNSEEN